MIYKCNGHVGSTGTYHLGALCAYILGEVFKALNRDSQCPAQGRSHPFPFSTSSVVSYDCVWPAQGSNRSHALASGGIFERDTESLSRSLSSTAACSSAAAAAVAFPGQSSGHSSADAWHSQLAEFEPCGKAPEDSKADKKAPSGLISIEDKALWLYGSTADRIPASDILLEDSDSRRGHQGDPAQQGIDISSACAPCSSVQVGLSASVDGTLGIMGDNLATEEVAAVGQQRRMGKRGCVLGLASGCMPEGDVSFSRPARLKGDGREGVWLGGCASAASQASTADGRPRIGRQLSIDASDCIPRSSLPCVPTAVVKEMPAAVIVPPHPTVAPVIPALSPKTGLNPSDGIPGHSEVLLSSAQGPETGSSSAGLPGQEAARSGSAVSEKLQGVAVKEALARDSSQMRSDFVRDI